MSERLIGRVAGIQVMVHEDAASTHPAVVTFGQFSSSGQQRLSLDEVRDLILLLEAVGNIADVWRRTTFRETGAAR